MSVLPVRLHVHTYIIITVVTIMQLFVGEDGFVGSLLEHSAADGPAAIVIDVFTLDLLYVMHHNNNIVLGTKINRQVVWVWPLTT